MKLKNIALAALFTLAVAGGSAEFFHHTDNRSAIQAQVMQATPGSAAQSALVAARETEHGKAALGLLSVFAALATATGSLRRKAAPSASPS